MKELTASKAQNAPVATTAASAAPKANNSESANSFSREMAKRKEADIEERVSAMMEVTEDLEQDRMEGVEEDEWEEVRGSQKV